MIDAYSELWRAALNRKHEDFLAALEQVDREMYLELVLSVVCRLRAAGIHPPQEPAAPATRAVH